MVYYNHQNIANAVQAQSVFPNNVYLPLNTGRTVSNQVQSKGSFVDQRPANSVELTSWINTSIRRKRLILSYNPIKTVSAAYTADATKDVVFIVDTTATITLPDPSTCTGWTFHVRSLTGVTTTLDPTGSAQIDGGATASLLQNTQGT